MKGKGLLRDSQSQEGLLMESLPGPDPGTFECASQLSDLAQRVKGIRQDFLRRNLLFRSYFDDYFQTLSDGMQSFASSMPLPREMKGVKQKTLEALRKARLVPRTTHPESFEEGRDYLHFIKVKISHLSREIEKYHSMAREGKELNSEVAFQSLEKLEGFFTSGSKLPGDEEQREIFDSLENLKQFLKKHHAQQIQWQSKEAMISDLLIKSQSWMEQILSGCKRWYEAEQRFFAEVRRQTDSKFKRQEANLEKLDSMISAWLPGEKRAQDQQSKSWERECGRQRERLEKEIWDYFSTLVAPFETVLQQFLSEVESGASGEGDKKRLEAKGRPCSSSVKEPTS